MKVDKVEILHFPGWPEVEKRPDEPLIMAEITFFHMSYNEYKEILRKDDEARSKVKARCESS